jgi:hypothetical protein
MQLQLQELVNLFVPVLSVFKCLTVQMTDDGSDRDVFLCD